MAKNVKDLRRELRKEFTSGQISEKEYRSDLNTIKFFLRMKKAAKGKIKVTLNRLN